MTTNRAPALILPPSNLLVVFIILLQLPLSLCCQRRLNPRAPRRRLPPPHSAAITPVLLQETTSKTYSNHPLPIPPANPPSHPFLHPCAIKQVCTFSSPPPSQPNKNLTEPSLLMGQSMDPTKSATPPTTEQKSMRFSSRKTSMLPQWWPSALKSPELVKSVPWYPAHMLNTTQH